ncbi:MAG: PAS domain-containing protein [Steroidobacteraceae bacterium]
MNASLKDLSQALLEGRPDALLRRALEHWPGPALLFDALLRLRWCSAAARAQIECTAGNPDGAGFEDLRLPWPLSPEDFDAALAGQVVEIDAGTLSTRDGRHHACGVRLLPLQPGEGGGVLCSEAPAPALDSADTLPSTQHSFDAAQAGAWRWDFSRDECVIDARWCETLDLDPFPGPGHQAQWEHQIHPDDLPAYQRRRAELQRGSIQRFEVEYRILTRTHHWVWVLQRGRVTRRDPAGRPLQAVGLCIDIDRRKREETQLRTNESRLATALWGARAAFWQWHVPTDALTMSPMWFAMMQYTREQWDSIENPWNTRAHPDDLPAVNAAVNAYHAGETESLEYEYRMRTGTGEWKWLLDRGRAVEWDPDGKPVVVMGVTLDIDAQKQAELALRASQDRLATAVWGARMGLWELDFSTERTVWFNDWCAQNDVDPCDGTDHVDRWDANIHPDDVDEAARRFGEHVKGFTEYYDAEYRVRTRAGKWMWVFERSLVVERDASGAARRMVGICMDITARHEQTERQHFAQPWLETALEVGRGGMWSWDLESGAVNFTETYYRLLGIDPQDARADATLWDEHIHPEDLPRVRAAARLMLQGAPGVYDVEYRMRHADGRWIWVHDRARVQQRDADGRARQVVGFVVDVSESHAAREALRASEERFRYATQAARGVVYDIDYATQQVERIGTEALLGVDDDALGHLRDDWIARIDPDDAVRFHAQRQLGGAVGSTQETAYRVRHGDGHWLHVWDHAIVVAAREGQPLRRIGFVQDVSEQLAEHLRLGAQAQLLALVEAPVALLERDGRLRTTSPAFDARFGAGSGGVSDGQGDGESGGSDAQPGGLRGRALRELVAVDDARWTAICAEMSAAGTAAGTRIELTCRHRDGSTFPCTFSVRAVEVAGEPLVLLSLLPAGTPAEPPTIPPAAH